MKNNLINSTKTIILSQRDADVYRRCSKELEVIYYNEIVDILRNNTVDSECLIDYYGDLMSQLETFYNPELAYIAGETSMYESPLEAYSHYINTLTTSSSYILISNQLSTLFDEIAMLIGESELLLDYSNTFRECRCAISNNIAKFFNLGFYNSRLTTEVA